MNAIDKNSKTALISIFPIGREIQGMFCTSLSSSVQIEICFLKSVLVGIKLEHFCLIIF